MVGMINIASDCALHHPTRREFDEFRVEFDTERLGDNAFGAGPAKGISARPVRIKPHRAAHHRTPSRWL